MIAIDCAGDIEIANEVVKYLNLHSFHSKIEDSIVIVAEDKIEQILKLFLKETNRLQYNLRKIDSSNFLLSKEIPIEDFGFHRCEMCGYVVPSEEELMVHRRAHGIQLL
jgi:hypothetical protein